jgi:hypothetical protein
MEKKDCERFKNEMPISAGKGICKYTYKKRAGPLESAQNGKTKKWRRKTLIQKEYFHFH